MTFSLQVTPDMVKEIEISPICHTSRPCNHEISIKLIDGRVRAFIIDTWRIQSLLEAVDADKVILHKWDRNHFQYKLNLERESAETILTKFFRSLYSSSYYQDL